MTAQFTLIRYLTTVLDSIKDGAILVGVEAGNVFRLLLTNKAFHTISGYKIDCVGKEIREFANPDRYKFIEKQLRKVVAHNESVEYVSWSMVPAGRRAFEVEMIPLPNSSGTVVQIIVLLRDITKLAKMKEEVEALRAAEYTTEPPKQQPAPGNDWMAS